MQNKCCFQNRNSHLLFRQRVIYGFLGGFQCVCAVRLCLAWGRERKGVERPNQRGREDERNKEDEREREREKGNESQRKWEKSVVEFVPIKTTCCNHYTYQNCRLRLNRIQYANQNETFLSIAKQTAISITYSHTESICAVRLVRASLVHDQPAHLSTHFERERRRDTYIWNHLHS